MTFKPACQRILITFPPSTTPDHIMICPTSASDELHILGDTRKISISTTTNMVNSQCRYVQKKYSINI